MSNKKGVILFVDDEFYVLQTLKAILRRDFLEYHLLLAQGGADAMKMLEEIPSEERSQLIVFSDWLMPGIKGDELLVMIAEKYPHTINFLLSGMINQEPSKDVFEKGKIKQIIQKPWDNSQLVELIKSSIN
jgi:response regulator RpfG family c-di-GMP phosphodiesterase